MDINDRVYVAKKDPAEREKLIEEYTPFIIKQLSLFTNKYIDEKNSDELSIGLIAFNEAIDSFDNTKGSFLSFSSLLIKRRLIDFLRKSQQNIVPLDLYIEKETDYEAENRKLEIISFVNLLSLYNITLEDLVKQSPKHSDTRKIATKIAYTICANPELLSYLKTKKNLPIKELTDVLKISRKTIEKHRKYIIALVIIISEDLPILKQYISLESEVSKI
ncbi:MAG TPA: RNA polymerase sigma factor SigI [Clostridia bacterium]|nr:RNA polymerase sigma factor SigI [Clostridia bacterium]